MDAVRAALGTAGWGDAVLFQLAHTHPATGGGGDSLQKRWGPCCDGTTDLLLACGTYRW